MKDREKKQKDSFKKVIRRLKERNATVLWARAVAASRVSELTLGCSKELAFSGAGAALSELLIMDCLTLDSIDLWPEVTLGLSFHGDGKLHVSPAYLRPEVESIILEQATALWERLDERNTSSQSWRGSGGQHRWERQEER
jgi:hypothetical protein